MTLSESHLPASKSTPPSQSGGTGLERLFLPPSKSTPPSQRGGTGLERFMKEAARLSMLPLVSVEV